MDQKPFAPSAEQNREAILTVLKKEFRHATTVLEIGSGTGQHAVYFSKHLTHLTWQPSDKQETLTGISMWIDSEKLANALAPIELDVCNHWPEGNFDAAFAANVAHIMHWNEIEAMFSGLGRVLTDSAAFCLYGPFNYNGEYTSESNRQLDLWLKSRDPDSCIRDKNDLDQLAIKNGLQPHTEWSMPTNNKIVCWKK